MTVIIILFVILVVSLLVFLLIPYNEENSKNNTYHKGKDVDKQLYKQHYIAYSIRRNRNHAPHEHMHHHRR